MIKTSCSGQADPECSNGFHSAVEVRGGQKAKGTPVLGVGLDGNPWETHGKPMGNPWETHGKPGNPWEKMG